MSETWDDPEDGTARASRSTRSESAGRTPEERPSLPARIALFYRQVIAELRKVIWPTRTELITYTTVVIVFVVAIATIVGFFDYVFTKGVLQVFGN